MTLKDIGHMFHRSISHTFELKKFLCLFVTLAVSGLIFLFFQAVALYVAPWLKFPLQCLPLFIAIGLIMAVGSLMVCTYAREIEGEEAPIFHLAWHSWDLALKSAYLAIPLFLIFLVFWILIGIFMLLKTIPYVGSFLGILLAFAPFLLNLGILLLFLTALFAFFYASPPVALVENIKWRELYKRFKQDIFSNLLFLGIAFVPLWVVWKFVSGAALMSFQFYSQGDAPIEKVLQSLFMMLPFVALLTPPFIFFFNFAYENYLRNEEIYSSDREV